MHYMFCISGFSGAGKDECASRLVNHYQAVQTGLADPGKRHMADAYDFTEQQLYGPSHFRNAGDVRIPKNIFYDRKLQRFSDSFPSDLVEAGEEKYKFNPEKKYWTYSAIVQGYQPRPHVLLEQDPRHKFMGESMKIFVQEGDPEFWLSPREALQQYMEKMNQLDIYTWIRKGIENQLFLATRKYGYNRMMGLVQLETAKVQGISSTRLSVVPQGENIHTCFADFRHIPEIQYTKELAERSFVKFQPVLIRVKRPNIPKPPYDHRSETEQVKIRDAAFDAIVHNDKDLPHLYAQIDAVISRAISGDIPPNPWKTDYVIPGRKPEEGYAP